MQNAKDTFYMTLRDRLAGIDPTRVVPVRGQLRPAVVVDENEMPERAVDAGVFHLAWGKQRTDRSGSVPMDVAECSITFRSSGAAAGSTLTRGREMNTLLTNLDAMLQPASATKRTFSDEGSVALKTNVFWYERGDREVRMRGEMLEATASVIVMTYREEGEV